LLLFDVMPRYPHSAARLAGFELAAPTEADAIASLERVFGRERGRSIWSDACRSAGVQEGQVLYGRAMERVAEALAVLGGAAAAVARSLTIRMRNHAQLAARTPAEGTRTWP
jgi:hypothetical protein